MNGKTYINGDELTALANSLKSKSENILSTYKGDCSQAIQMSSECLQLSGLNTTEFFQALEKIYTQVNERIASFADFLTNVVVAEYNAVSEAITNSFNNEFASEISSLLGISVTASIGPITAPAIPGTPRPAEPINTIPKHPYNGQVVIDKDGNGNKDEVITLDPREKDGFGKPELQVMSREEGNNSPTPVYLDDNGTAVSGEKPTQTTTTETTETTTTGTTTKPNLPPINESGGRGHAANDPIRAVQFDEGTSSTAKPSAQATTPTVETTTKPNLPPINESGGRGHAANDPIRAVQFDEGTSSTAKPSVQATTPTVETTKPSTATTTVSTGGTKPNLPPLPTKPSTSTSRNSYSSGGYVYTGGGGGGGMAAAIALDSMANPLNRLK